MVSLSTPSRALCTLAALLLSAMAPWRGLKTAPKKRAQPAIASSPIPGGLSAPPAAAPPSFQWELQTTSTEKNSQWSVLTDIGFPDGAMLGVALQPAVPVRLSAAFGYNTISPGVRLGLQWLPLGHTWLVSAQVGHYFEGDASHWASKPNSADSILLERVGYNFLNLRTGAEWSIGPLSYFGLIGLSYMRAPIEQVERLLAPRSTGNGSTSLQVPETPTLTVILPTIQLGIRISL